MVRLHPMADDFFKRPFWFYIKQHPKNFCFGLLSLLLTNSLDVLPPLLIGKALDLIAEGRPTKDVAEVVGIIVILTAFLALFRYLWRIFWGRFHHSVANDLRKKIYDKLLDFGPSFYQKNTIGHLMSLMTYDVNSFRMGIGPGLLILFDAIFFLIVLPPLMIAISWDWTSKTLILMPLVPFVVYKMISVLHRRYRHQQNKYSEMSAVSQEIVAGSRVIKSYGQEENQTRIFNDYSRKFQEACDRSAKVDSAFGPVLEISVSVGCVILLWIGAPDVIQGTVTLGSLFTFYQYIQRIVWPMEALGIGFSHVQQGKASFDRIAQLLSTPSDLPDEGQTEIDHFENLEFDSVLFFYPNETRPALRDLSFSLKAGQTLAITGVTGSGKSTLVDLLCRNFEAQSGEIRINGVAIKNLPRRSLRKLLGVVPQESFVFSRRISENIALGRDSWTMDEVVQTSEMVRLDEEIQNIPGKYDSYLGERGVNLSGGQRQRLTLARAMMKNSEIIIFDDSLSAVDAKTEAYILENLRSRSGSDKGQTTIIISHRIASLKWADQILVLDQGQVEAIGTHDELLKTSPTYLKLFEMQSSGEQHV